MPIQYAGGTNVNATFTGAVRSDIQSNLRTQLVTAGWTNLSGATGTSTGPGNVGTVTITIASPGVVTFTGHGFLGGERIILQTSGALPTGLSVNTVYFVKFIGANTFNLALTLGGANINTTGSQSGTHTLNTESVLLQSAVTPQLLQVNVRLKDNRGNCIQVSIESTDGTLLGANDTSHGGNLLPAVAKTFRVIANKYQFFCMVPGTYLTARNFVGAGVPYIPAPNAVPANAGWMACDSITDASATQNANWRTSLTNATGTAGYCNMQMMWAGNIWDANGGSNLLGSVLSVLQLVIGVSALGNGGNTAAGQPAFYRWANGDIFTSDGLLAWGATAAGDEPQLRAQLWDALVIQDSFSGDTTTSFDSHNWYCLTNVNTGSGGGVTLVTCRGSVFVVVP